MKFLYKKFWGIPKDPQRFVNLSLASIMEVSTPMWINKKINEIKLYAKAFAVYPHTKKFGVGVYAVIFTVFSIFKNLLQRRMRIGRKKSRLWSRIFSVDRGGVEPLKQVSKNAPETARTQPSNPLKNNIKLEINRKAPINRSFSEYRAISIKAFLLTYFHYTPIRIRVNSVK